jgi:CHAT domain-containing protein
MNRRGNHGWLLGTISYPGALAIILLLALNPTKGRGEIWSEMSLLPAGEEKENREQDVRVLEPGKSIERELTGDQAQSYTIVLTAEQYLHVVVDQRGIDVVVALFGPDGRKLMEVDSPNGDYGTELVSLLAKVPGNYRLEVRSPDKSAAAGHYVLKIDEFRKGKPSDLKRISADKMYVEGTQFYAQSTPEANLKALRKYEEALSLYTEGEDSSGQAKSLVTIGSVYGLLGNSAKGIEYYEKAIPLLHSVGDLREEAKVLNLIGVYAGALGERQRALKSLNKALPLWQASGDHLGEVKTLLSLGFIYSSLGDKQHALACYHSARSLLQKVPDQMLEANLFNSMGEIYGTTGESQKALDYFHQALPLMRTANDKEGEGNTLNNIGKVYDDLGENKKAIDYYTRALALLREAGEPYEVGGVLENIGTSYKFLGNQLKALEYYNEALSVFVQSGNVNAQANLLQNIGATYDSADEAGRVKALEYYNKALNLLRDDENRVGMAALLHNIAVIYHDSGTFDKAWDYSNQSLQMMKAIGDRPGEASTLLNLADTERSLNRLSSARSRVEEAIKIVESLRSGLISQNLRTTYFSSTQVFYEFYIDVLMRLHKQQPLQGFDALALEASELARARTLLELLTEAQADIRQGVDSKLLERERFLQHQLNDKALQRRELLNGTDAAAQAAVAREIEDLKSQYEAAEVDIRKGSPRYAALTQPQPLSHQAIQQQLAPDTLLLEYSLGAKVSYLWLVSSSEIKSFELPPRKEIETAARSFYEFLSTPDRLYIGGDQSQTSVGGSTDEQRREMLERTSRLSQMLLGPIASQLAQKRLVIVADGALQYLPFAALPDPSAVKQKNGNLQPLVVQHEIVNLPSVSSLATLRSDLAGRKPAPKDIVVLADPVFYPDDVRVKKKSTQEKVGQQTNGSSEPSFKGLVERVEKIARATGARREGTTLLRLPGTRREGEAILTLAAVQRTRRAFDFDASRALTRSGELSQYRYVHFATHGLLDSLHPELTAIVLSLVDEQGNPQDGFLRAHEVYNLNLPAEVVVLSGCQTGLGKEVKGEGLIGLTRGFMYAGAARVVVSLWSVDDEATAKLMIGFYGGMIKDGKRPAEALRAAQIEMLKSPTWQSAHYWAAFVLQGEWK